MVFSFFSFSPSSQLWVVPKSALNFMYWLTRIILLRFLGFIYAIAFLVSLQQNRGLLGISGLLPADRYVSSIFSSQTIEGKIQEFFKYPTLFVFVEPNDTNLERSALIGISLAVFLVYKGAGNGFILSVLWLLYISLCNVGQTWYSFGWESQLLETGFLAIFSVPLFHIQKFPTNPMPLVVIWGYRWLIFRIMLGAGLYTISILAIKQLFLS